VHKLVAMPNIKSRSDARHVQAMRSLYCFGNLSARFLEQSLDPISPAAFPVDPPLGAIGPAVRDRQLFAQ
jgi:hypothetical protein